MRALAGLSILLLVATSVGVGVRLLISWRRTRGLPELLLGGMLLLTVGVGYPGLILSSRGGDWAAPLYVVSNLAVNAGFALLFLFTWRVFRPERAWAKGLACTGLAILCVCAAWRIQDVLTGKGVRIGSEVLGASLLQTTPVIVAYLWTAWESLRYHGLMRRRVRIGLADPVVSDRFLLWGTMSLFTALGTFMNSLALAFGIDVMQSPLVLFGSSVTGCAQVVLLFLAFLPPQVYLDRVRSRAARSVRPLEA